MKEDLATFLRRWIEFLQGPVETKEIVEKLVEDDSGHKSHNVRSSGTRTWTLRDRSQHTVSYVRLRPSWLFNALGLPTEAPVRWPDWEREKEIRLTPSLEEEVMDVYEQSNRAFAEAIGMDLSQYGYY
jgi:hypothetical protein